MKRQKLELELHGPYILHLATHGFFEPEDSSSEENPNESQSPGTKSDLTTSKFFKNPMHRSGLALAGANTTIADWKRGEAPPIEEDGILTAEDVSVLDLKGTWLVTLSACDTGSGEARAGEGVMGLRRGFIQAGAQNLLMSLADQRRAHRPDHERFLRCRAPKRERSRGVSKSPARLAGQAPERTRIG